MTSFFSVLPSLSNILPTYNMSPLLGVLGTNFNLSLALIMASQTDCLLILSLMLSHLDYSLLINLVISLRFFLGGTIIDIIDVPFPLDSMSFLINLLILNCSTDRQFCSSDSIYIANCISFIDQQHILCLCLEQWANLIR